MPVRDTIGYVMVFLATLALLMLFSYRISRADDAHQHPPEDVQLHEKFYARWMMPVNWDGNGRRTKSCCDKRDCYPSKVKREGATWFVWQREHERWWPIPDHIIEQNQSDPQESPDGQAHVCMNASKDAPIVFCFTHGVGG